MDFEPQNTSIHYKYLEFLFGLCRKFKFFGVFAIIDWRQLNRCDYIHQESFLKRLSNIGPGLDYRRMSEEGPFFKTESSGSPTSLRLRVPWVYFWLQCICLLNNRGAGLQCMYSGLFLTKVKAPNRISIRTSIVVYPIIHGTTCNTSLLFIQ